MPSTLLTRALALVVAPLTLTACKTTFRAGAKNATQQSVVAKVFVYEGKNQQQPEPKLQHSLGPGEELPQTVIGKYTAGTPVEVRFDLNRGGVADRARREIPSEPNPFDVNLILKSFAAQALNISDASTIEREITDLTGTYLSPTDDVGNLLVASMGGLYRKRMEGDTPIFERLMDPTILGARITPAEFSPDAGAKPEYKLKLTVDSSNVASLQAQIPTTVKLNTDFNRAVAYRYEFVMQATGWKSTLKSWYSIQTKLQETAAGQKVLADVGRLLAQYGDLYYLDRAFVMGNVDVQAYQSESIGAGVDVGVKDFLTAGGAWKWTKDLEDTKKYTNLVLRVGFSQITPIALLRDAKGIVNVNPISPGDTAVKGFVPGKEVEPTDIRGIATRYTRPEVSSTARYKQ